MPYVSKAYWSADVFKPHPMYGATFDRVIRFGSALMGRDEALRVLQRRLKHGESAGNLTPPGDPHTPWPEADTDLRNAPRYRDVIAWGPEA